MTPRDPAGGDLVLPPHARSAGEARRFVTGRLDEWGLDGLVDTAALLTSEIVTNAVLHARTALRVSVRRTGSDGVTVEIHDGSRHEPQRRQHSQVATTGRGMHLLDELATSWNVEVQGEGKVVRFTLTDAADPWAAFRDDVWNEGA